MGRFTGGQRVKMQEGVPFIGADQGDHVLGSHGNDTADLGGGNDLFNGRRGDDEAHGGDGNDNLNGNAGDDTLYGDAGDDNISGGDGEDSLYGGDDDDVLEGGAGADYIDGGPGNDTASYEDAPEDGPLVTDFGTFNGVAVSLLSDRANNSDATGDELDSIENLIGSDFDDFLQGDDNANVIHGGDGDDDLRGEGGDDTIYGGAGDDDITGGTGQDTLFGGNGGGDDTINVGTAGSLDGRDGDDDVIVAAGSYAENGTDAVFNYDESTHVSVDNDDMFDFSDAFSFVSADSANWAAELDAFLTFDQPNSEIETAGDSNQVWFTVSELDATETFNAAEQVSVLVDNALFTNDGTGWALVDDDILT